jgi:hypothetical protein
MMLQEVLQALEVLQHHFLALAFDPSTSSPSPPIIAHHNDYGSQKA